MKKVLLFTVIWLLASQIAWASSYQMNKKDDGTAEIVVNLGADAVGEIVEAFNAKYPKQAICEPLKPGEKGSEDNPNFLCTDPTPEDWTMNILKTYVQNIVMDYRRMKIAQEAAKNAQDFKL